MNQFRSEFSAAKGSRSRARLIAAIVLLPVPISLLSLKSPRIFNIQAPQSPHLIQFTNCILSNASVDRSNTGCCLVNHISLFVYPIGCYCGNLHASPSQPDGTGGQIFDRQVPATTRFSDGGRDSTANATCRPHREALRDCPERMQDVRYKSAAFSTLRP